MAKFDFKKAYIRLKDGTKPSVLFDSAVANSDITFTAVESHIGGHQAPIRIRSVNPGTNSAALVISVSGRDITISLATDGAAAATTTATQAVAAIVASAQASALVTAAAAGTGAGLLSVIGYTSLANGPNSLTIKTGEGNLTWSEKKNREYSKNRGLLETIRDGDEEPVDVKLDFLWEFLRAVGSSGTPTVEDVLKNRGEASAWVSSSSDPCEPFAVDLEIEYAPACGGLEREFIRFNDFRYEDLSHDSKQGQISISGKANVTEPEVNRVA